MAVIDVQSKAAPEPQPEAAPEPQSKAEPEAWAGTEPEAQATIQPEAQAASQPEPEVQPAAEAGAAARDEPKADAKEEIVKEETKAQPEAQTGSVTVNGAAPRAGSQRIVVLGCTSGAGQTVTALTTARLLAGLRAQPVGALDLNPGDGSLEARAHHQPAGSLRELLNGNIPVGPDGRAAPGFEVIGAGVGGMASVRALDERDFAQLGEHLAGRYRISLVDPGASAVSRVLGLADQLVLVAPASGDAPRAVSMTRQWLEDHDHRELAANAVMVVNGVSNRSMSDVEQAEAVVAGRCRAIIRVPWDDHLGAEGAGGVRIDALSAPARDALTSLATLLADGTGGAA